MADALSSSSAMEALASLSMASEELALSLALELSASLSATTKSKRPVVRRTTTTKGNEDGGGASYPIPLPDSIRACCATKSEKNALATASVCTESILSSLEKIASGGTKASEEMRKLESERYEVESRGDIMATALHLRGCANRGSQALAAQNYRTAAEAVCEYRRLLSTTKPRTSQTALLIAGDYTIQTHERTRQVMKQTILERYEAAVAKGDLAALSDLTPILGLLEMADQGVGMYLRFSRSTLSKSMDDPKPQPSQDPNEKEVVLQTPVQVPVCQSLAKVFNVGVMHLRHHLPMVAHSLGEADGDAALIQLVHLEVEKRAIAAVRQYEQEKQLEEMEKVGERVTALIEEKYVVVGILDFEGEGFLSSSLGGGSGLLQALMGLDDKYQPIATEISSKKPFDFEEHDCGFTEELGHLADVDAAMDEAALCLQHTESYERFIRHAVDQVLQARALRLEQKREERKRQQQSEEEKRMEADGAENQGASANDSKDEIADEGKQIEILPPHTPLNEAVAELGGHYSGLERSLLLASMQRAFLNATFPGDQNYNPIAILSGRTRGAPGFRALQTSVVEECLYAAQRSTMRAFATGHTGTASVAANYCADALGRVLLEVLSRRAELGISLLKPGEGLLVGQGGLFGQAAGLIRGAATGRAKIERNVGAKGTAGAGTHEDSNMMRYRVELGIARACANLNDLEVAVDYTQRLENKFLVEIDSSYPSCHETEQLRMCVKSLGSATDSFKLASNNSVEQLVSTIMTRVRIIANDAMGTDGAASASYLSSTVIGGGKATDRSTVRMNYDLDDEAYELAQVSEGYLSRLCSSIDELIEPLRVHLVPRLSDAVVLGVLSGASKRMEATMRRSRFTALGALSMDSDIRYFLNFAKERLDSPDMSSNVAICKACKPLARLSQIALLMNVDDLEDVVDLISVSKRKNNWDLNLEDAKAFLSLRVDFEGRKVNDLLRISDEQE